jgi:alpha-tubulin suppressor-like RCC1 family protein
MKNLFILFLSFLSVNNSVSQCWKVSSYRNHTVVLDNNGKIYGWGSGFNGELNSSIHSSYPNVIEFGNNLTWTSVKAGKDFTLALKSNGSLWACGINQYGQLGFGYTNNYQNSFNQIGVDTDWVKIFTGTHQNYAIKSNGTLWSWGDGTEGELGVGTTVPHYYPIQVGFSSDWKEISAGGHHILGLKNDGKLWAWGNNSNGQLGNGSYSQQNSPILISIESFKAIAAGSEHSIVIKSDGTLWATGYNLFGNLGIGSLAINSNVFVQVGTESNWSNVACTGSFTIALKTDGTLWGWGENYNGQLGNGTYDITNVPVQIGNDNDWVTIQTGEKHSIAVKSNQSIWSWGDNSYGQMGNGLTSSITYNTPQIFSSIDLTSCTLLSQNEITNTIGIYIYPNPTKDYIYVENSLNIITYSIIDLTGKIIISKPFTEQIDTRELANGMYLLELISGEKIYYKKIVKN